MPKLTLNLIKGDKTSSNTDYRDALPVNMYGVIRDILGAQGYMLCYPGLTQYATGQGIDRAGNYNDRFAEHYRVSGRSLIKVGTSGIVTDLGTIIGADQASMPHSFNTQCVVGGGIIYLYDSTNGLRIVDNPFNSYTKDGVWIDNYYIFTDGDIVYHTNITDEGSIDLLSFTTSEFDPDPSLGLGMTQDDKLIIFNRHSIEYYTNTASDNFAFQRLKDRAQKIGVVATHAKCEMNGQFYITGGRKEESLSVYLLGIGNSSKVGTREIDKILATYTEPELSDMRMESRMEDSVSFLLIHLPNETLCFNETVARKFGLDIAWSILKTDVKGDKTYRGINGVFEANRGQWVYGDKRNSNIGYLDNTVFTHYDEMIEWLLYTPLVNLEGMAIDILEIETIPGHTASKDATVAVSVTSDGLIYGKEWFKLYGNPLDYDNRFYIEALTGYIRDNIGFKLRGATTSRMAFAGVKLTYG